VLEAYATTGSSDLLCRIAASFHQDLQNALLALDRSPDVSRSISVVVLPIVVPPRALLCWPTTRAPRRGAPRHAETPPEHRPASPGAASGRRGDLPRQSLDLIVVYFGEEPAHHVLDLTEASPQNRIG
jgi:hypothetical protein